MSFVLDVGRVVGFLLLHLVIADYDPEQEQLLLHWPPGVVTITGPEAFGVLQRFLQAEGDILKADGNEILSVIFQAAVDADAVASGK